MRIPLLLILSCIYLLSRDNPFVSVLEKDEFPVANNVPEVLPLLTHTKISLPDTARSVEAIIVEYKNLNGSIEQKRVEINKQVDWHMPIVINHKKHTVKSKSYETIAKTPFIKFLQKGQTFRLNTSNDMIRHFMIANPHRIVIDFSRMSNFLSKKFKAKSGPLSVIRIGNHKNYYRVVLELDGQYEYKLEKISTGVQIHVR